MEGQYQGESQFDLFFSSLKNPSRNFWSLFKRRESSLNFLDGLRSIAILWVFTYHSLMCIQSQMRCFHSNHNCLNYLIRLSNNGDLGVDIFFVLSGFLICLILQKQCAKFDGKIDINNFLKSRFFRIWPALLIYSMFSIAHYQSLRKIMPRLLFISNYTGPPFDHIWSVSVEFQFYLVSPFLVQFLFKS